MITEIVIKLVAELIIFSSRTYLTDSVMPRSQTARHTHRDNPSAPHECPAPQYARLFDLRLEVQELMKIGQEEVVLV